jgi:PIN domain nuclease of toxin-antitoxin system
VKLLLDTHVVLWWLDDSPRLREVDRDAVGTAEAVHVSAASTWEIAIKQRIGKLEAPADQLDVVAEQPWSLTDITHDDAASVAALPDHHGDPFDRMLVAQAARRGLTLMTADRRLVDYPVAVRLVR